MLEKRFSILLLASAPKVSACAVGDATDDGETIVPATSMAEERMTDDSVADEGDR